MLSFNKILSEMRRRNVVQPLIPYLALVWLVLQVVSVVSPMLNFSPLVGTFIAILLFSGFPVLMLVSWYFEFTRDGLKRIEDAPNEKIKPLGWLRWCGLIGVFIGSTTMGYVYFIEIKQQVVNKQSETQTNVVVKAIAVLPLVDQSPEQDQGYLGVGLAEELTSLLGRTSEFSVSASSSSLHLAQQGLSPVDIGKRLEVDAVLTGTVRVSGDRLKLRLELIDTGTARTLWTESFSRKFADIFDIENQVSRAVVNLIQDTIVSMESIRNQARTNSTDAYVIYLKGREAYRKQTTESIKQARKLFEQALGLDPEYVQAYVGVADAVVMLAKGRSRFGILEPDIASRLASEFLEKALIRDPEFAQAYAIHGKVLELQKQEDDALQAYDKAIALNPSLSTAHMWRYILLQRHGRQEEALSALETAYRLDPVSIPIMYNRAFELAQLNNIESAKQQYQQLIEDFPESPMGYSGLAAMAFQTGELAQSLQLWKTVHEMSPDNQNYQQNYLGMLLALGLVEEVRRLTSDPAYDATIMLLSQDYATLFAEMDFQLAANPDSPWLAFEAGWYHALVGEQQKAVALLIQAKAGISDADMYAMPMCSPAVEIAWALKQAGELAEANQVAGRCETQLAAARENKVSDNAQTYLAARLAALKGDTKLSAQELDLALKTGWREWWSRKDPLFSQIVSQPAITDLFAQLDRDLSEQRQLALDLLALAPSQ